MAAMLLAWRRGGVAAWRLDGLFACRLAVRRRPPARACSTRCSFMRAPQTQAGGRRLASWIVVRDPYAV